MTSLRRIAAWLTLALLATVAPAHAQAGAAQLYVFVHGSQKAHALEKLLEDELGGVDVTVFGRVADLKTAVASAPPDALLARPPVLMALGMKPALAGKNRSGADEAMVVVSTEAVTAADLGGKVVGAVDLLGRKDMPRFVAELLRLSSPPKLQPVTKQEDLLPLLQLRAADVVLIDESALEEMRRRTALDLKTLRVPGAVVGLPALAVTGTRGLDVKARCARLSPAALASLGLTRFEED